jgi:hypothetical protein
MDPFKAFKEKLDQQHKWPDIYVFKFVVPIGRADEFNSEFPGEPFHEKTSKAGNYVSYTLRKQLHSSDEVVEMYLKARKIEGLIAL